MSEVISTAYLTGGLGNQLFQISHALCQSWKNRVSAKFNPISYTPNQGFQTQKYINNIFKEVVFESIDCVVHKIFEKTWNEPQINPIFDKSIEFHGYFQSSLNFLGYEKKIKKIFQPTDSFLKKISNKYPEIFEKNCTSIHIRRGDYLRHPNYHPVIDISYVNFCLSQIKSLDKIFVFSDDEKWVLENFETDKFIHINELEDYEQLWMMSLCKNNILSNSSFSWWSAFLNNTSDSNIFAPSMWFGPSGPNPHNNIYEKNWNIVSVFFENGKLLVK